MNNLRAARKAAGMKQTDVAKIVGICQSGYSDWERGKNKIDNKSLQKLAELYGCSVDYLLGREDTKTPAPEGHGGEGADAAAAAAADISEADVRAWLQAHAGELTPEDLLQVLGGGSADAAILALCRLLPDDQKAALVEIVHTLAKSQGLLPER